MLPRAGQLVMTEVCYRRRQHLAPCLPYRLLDCQCSVMFDTNYLYSVQSSVQIPLLFDIPFTEISTLLGHFKKF